MCFIAISRSDFHNFNLPGLAAFLGPTQIVDKDHARVLGIATRLIFRIFNPFPQYTFCQQPTFELLHAGQKVDTGVRSSHQATIGLLSESHDIYRVHVLRSHLRILAPFPIRTLTMSNAATNNTDAANQVGNKSGQSASAFAASLVTSIIIFAVEGILFILIKDRFTRI